MALDVNSSFQHIPLSDLSEKSKDSPNQSNDDQSSCSSIICHVIPVALVKATSSMVGSALNLAIPLFAIHKFPDNSHLIAGLVITTNGLGVLLSSLFIGNLIASTSDEFCTIISILLRTSFLLLLCAVDNYLSIWIIVALVFGLCQGSIAISMNHILASKIKSKKRGRITSLVAGCSRSGRAIGPLYVGYISDLRVALLISAAISILSLILLCGVMIPPKININTSNIANGTTSGSFSYFKASWKQTKWNRLDLRNWVKSKEESHCKTAAKRQRCYVWSRYGSMLLFYGIFGFGLKWVRQTRKLILTFRGHEMALSNHQIGEINSLSFASDFVLFIFAGFLMDRFGRKATAIPGLIGFVVALILLNFVRDFKELLAISGLFGLSDGITVGLMMTSAADLAPSECKSEFIAAFKLFTTMPQVLAPSVVGALCNEVSIESAALLSAGIGTVALFWITCVLEDPSKHNARKEMENGLNELNGQVTENGAGGHGNDIQFSGRISTLDTQLIIADEDSAAIKLEKDDGI